MSTTDATAGRPGGLSATEYRHVRTLYRAWLQLPGALIPGRDAALLYRALRSAVYALVPGRQRPRHLARALALATAAAARTIRRQAQRERAQRPEGGRGRAD